MTTYIGLGFFVLSVIGMLILWLISFSILSGLFYGISRLFYSKDELDKYGNDMFYMMPAFILGGFIGLLGGAEISIKIAIFLNIQDELPRLFN